MSFPEMLSTYITIDDDIRSFLNTQTEKISVKKGSIINVGKCPGKDELTFK